MNKEEITNELITLRNERYGVFSFKLGRDDKIIIDKRIKELESKLDALKEQDEQ